MGRILAIDYGKKRTGIAITDESNIIASGLCTIETNKLLTFLQESVKKYNITVFVVGEPKRLNNTPAQFAEEAEKLVVTLGIHFPKIQVERIDERFTSKMAFQTMIDSGLKKKARRNKALVDEISATIMLQSYMSQKGI